MAAVLLLIILGLMFPLWRLIANYRATLPPRARVLAPDDDPDFLRELDRRTRQQDDDAS